MIGVSQCTEVRTVHGSWSDPLSGWKLLLIWVACVIIGALVGYAIGWLLWKAGLELIGSAVALVGAGAGGFVVLFFFMRWADNRGYRR